MSAAAEFRWTPHDPKEELRLAFEQAPLGLAQCQRKGEVIALNPALEQMLGDRSRITRPLWFADLIHPQHRADGERLLRELFEGERKSFHIETKIIGADSRSTRWTIWSVPGARGNPDWALAIAEEVAENGEAEQRLRQAERLEALGRLTSGVVHDFNNILTGILLYSDLLAASLEPSHRAREYAEEISKAAKQATGLARQLLAVARPADSEPRLLSLNEIAEGMRDLLSRLIGENIELKFLLDRNLGLIQMAPTHCQQILVNLVLNARDAMPNGGQIRIETSNCKIQVFPERRFGGSSPALLRCALFVVGDTGRGMDATTRSHLFEAFFTGKPGKGTGLGLATVHDIVTSNGGLIHVDSAPAQGTRVSVLLPLAHETATRPEHINEIENQNSQQELLFQEGK